MIKYLIVSMITVVSSLFTSCVTAQSPSVIKKVEQSTMSKVYREVQTPYKYGMVMIHEDTSSMIDCATIFRHDSTWYMTYLVYDGYGYETWLASSENLLEWQTLGVVLPYTSEDSPEWNQSAGYPALIDHTWGGSYSLNKYDSLFWMSYFGSNSKGYERGKLSIGMAYTDKPAHIPHAWKRFKEPVMTTHDDDAGVWEQDKLYKSSIIWDKDRITGAQFVMFYNAVGDTSSFKNWVERIGVATSDDMTNWKRYEGNPVIDHHVGLTGDAVVQRMDSLYVMFYYGAFYPEGRKEAFNSFACSYDLFHWTDWTGEDLIKPSQEFDNKYAHKPCVVKWNGVVYHFYTAVNEKEQRGLAVATSKPLGKSSLNFEDVDNKLKRH